MQAFCLAVLLASGAGACAVDPAGRAAPAPAAADALAPITALIGDAECDDPGQCRAVGIGAKPCGGPSRYLPWSSKRTDPSALRAAVDAQARAEKEAAKSRGLVSDCRLLPEPTAVCRPRASDGRKTCQLGEGGARSAI